jgi:hypothetical protein
MLLLPSRDTAKDIIVLKLISVGTQITFQVRPRVMELATRKIEACNGPRF